VKYVMVPPEIEILDVWVEVDMSKMRFYNSHGISKLYDTEKDLKMKVREREFEDYRKFSECTFDWQVLIKPGKKKCILE